MYLIIDSRNRTSESASSSDFKINLNRPISGETVRLKEILIPNVIYNIRAGINDRVVFRRSSTNYSVQITPGKWSVTTLLNMIQTGMNSADANTYVCSYDATTMKVTIGGASAFILNWTISSSSMYRELGFTNTDTTSGTSQTSVGIVQLYRPQKFIIRIEEMGYSGVTDAGVPYSFNGTLNVAAGDIQDFTEASWFDQKVKTVLNAMPNQLTIKLQYIDGQNLDLNNGDWILVLEFEN